jgi:transcriptional regulator with XRE-family HTH domain
MNGRALLAWNLKRLRLRHRITQEALAVDARIDRASVSLIERAKGNPTLDLLERFAGALRTPLAEFFRVPRSNAKPPKELPVGRRPRR